MSVLVSVIIPNYNHAPYLQQRIDTVLSQTFQDFEVIILDDCSRDNSREIINEYKSDPRVRIVFNETNSGCVFKQWNKGLKMAAGKYVWIAESDDYSAPTFLEVLVNRLEKNPDLGLAFCNSWRVVKGEITAANQRWFGEFADFYQQDFEADGRQYVARQMLFMNPIPNTSSVVFRRALAEKIGWADETFLLSGDWLFWIKLLGLSNLAYLATPLNYYRYHEQTARHANAANGVMIEDACRISIYVLNNFPVADEDAQKIRERLTGWYVETMFADHAGIPSARQQTIHRLAQELNPAARRRLWFRRTGLQWLWLGCRRRLLDLCKKPA